MITIVVSHDHNKVVLLNTIVVQEIVVESSSSRKHALGCVVRYLTYLSVCSDWGDVKTVITDFLQFIVC